ncbi:MAG: hypothetical protein AAF321_07165 [Pseudomonadota bacterium]
MKRHWDPFEGEVRVAQPASSGRAQGLDLPQWVQQLPVGLAVASFGWLFFAIFTDRPFVLPLVAVVVSFVLVFGIEHLVNAKGRRDDRRTAFARSRGWSYDAERITPVAAGDGAKRSERLERIARARPKLVSLRMGGLDGEFWGYGEDGLPLWIAVSAIPMNAAFAADARLRNDRFGGSGATGLLFSLVGAYQLGRDTGLRAAITPAGATDVLGFSRTLETESVAFNEAFRVTAEPEDAAGVLRLLSPATQTTLLDLLENYRRLALVVEGDTLFFRAEDRIVGKNAQDEAMDRLLPTMLAQFEQAKLTFKRYVE